MNCLETEHCTKRYCALIQYKGTHYQGWQKQKHSQKTIQYVLEKALSQLANETIEIVASGRTDSGVHASQQFIHFDSSAKRSIDNWLNGSNQLLPDDISVNQIQIVDNHFHARFDAVERGYHYYIYNNSQPSAIFKEFSSLVRLPLDIVDMQQGASFLLGKHDFSSFRASACQAKSPIRTVNLIKIEQFSNHIVIEFKANAFLHHMIRNIVGALIIVGKKRQEPEWIKELLSNKDRQKSPATASSKGLFLSYVNYPKNFMINNQKSAPLLFDKL